MFDVRMQILVSEEQRRLLHDEARATGSSAAALVRDAIDARFGRPSREERIAAAERLAGGHAEFVPADELRELIDSRFDESAPQG